MVTATQHYSSNAEAEQFLTEYVAGLDELGYLMINPEKVSSSRQFVYLNEDLAKYVGFDYMPGNGEASVLFEFFAASDSSSSMMLNALGR